MISNSYISLACDQRHHNLVINHIERAAAQLKKEEPFSRLLGQTVGQPQPERINDKTHTRGDVLFVSGNRQSGTVDPAWPTTNGEA